MSGKFRNFWQILAKRGGPLRPYPALFIWGTYDSTGSAVFFARHLPACFFSFLLFEEGRKSELVCEMLSLERCKSVSILQISGRKGLQKLG